MNHLQNWLRERGMPDPATGSAFTNTRSDTSTHSLFEQAFTNAPIGMALVALDGRWLTVNRQLCRMVGYDEAQLLQKTFQDLTYPPDLDADIAHVQELLDGRVDGYQMEKRYVRADGRPVWARLSVSLVRDKERKPQFFISQIEDIDNLKSVQEELEGRNRELQRFTRLASHDLREPLRAISGFATLIRNHVDAHLTDEDREYFGFIDAGVKRMDEMIRALGELARLDQHPLAPEAFPMSKVVEQALQNLDAAVEESQAEIVVDTLPKVSGSRTLLVQLMQHVLGNAIKYRRAEPPQVMIRCSLEEGSHHFRVTDNGIGICPQDLPGLFEPFRRSSGGGVYAGTSVGLTFSQRIVERHGGRIWIESVPGTGTTVHFTLPAAQESRICEAREERRKRVIPRRMMDIASAHR